LRARIERLREQLKWGDADMAADEIQANRASPIFTELAAILRKTSGLSDVVAETLDSLSDRIDVAFIFGSVARGAETAASDVDMLIIGSVDFDAVQTLPKSLEVDSQTVIRLDKL